MLKRYLQAITGRGLNPEQQGIEALRNVPPPPRPPRLAHVPGEITTYHIHWRRIAGGWIPQMNELIFKNLADDIVYTTKLDGGGWGITINGSCDGGPRRLYRGTPESGRCIASISDNRHVVMYTEYGEIPITLRNKHWFSSIVLFSFQGSEFKWYGWTRMMDDRDNLLMDMKGRWYRRGQFCNMHMTPAGLAMADVMAATFVAVYWDGPEYGPRQ